MRVDIEFPAARGTTLRGWLHLPDGRGPWPGVVLAHGFSATKEMGLEAWAAALADAGFVAMTYDHRGFGASDGEPRLLVDPWTQTCDFGHALTWLSSRPEVDPDRLAVWGSSYSGGEAIVLGAVDQRVRAVVANVPWAALPGSFDGDTRAALGAMRAVLKDDERDDPSPVGPFAVVQEEGNDLPVFLDGDECSRWFLDVGRRPGARWENRVWFGSGGTTTTFDPGAAIVHLAPTPLLMLVATDDRVAATELALGAFERAGQPKQLELLEGDHFVDYAGPAFDKAITATIAFLRRWL